MPALVVVRGYGLAGSLIVTSDPMPLDHVRHWADTLYPDLETIIVRSDMDEHGHESPLYRGRRVMTRYQGRWTTP